MTPEKARELADEMASEWRDPDYYAACECEGEDPDCDNCGGEGWREL